MYKRRYRWCIDRTARVGTYLSRLLSCTCPSAETFAIAVTNYLAYIIKFTYTFSTSTSWTAVSCIGVSTGKTISAK